jgi:excisionase family DNA binding protein
MTMVEKTYVNQKEVAAMLGVSPSTVRNMVKDGRLKPRKIYKRALYDAVAVRRLLQDDDVGEAAAAAAPVTPADAGARPQSKGWFGLGR